MTRDKPPKITAETAAADALDSLLRANVGWIELIKTLRAAYGLGLEAAYRLALSHEGWRQWVDRRLRSDALCQKMARSNLRRCGDDAWVERVDGDLRVRRPRQPG